MSSRVLSRLVKHCRRGVELKGCSHDKMSVHVSVRDRQRSSLATLVSRMKTLKTQKERYDDSTRMTDLSTPELVIKAIPSC
jgi:hypothetical protein